MQNGSKTPERGGFWEYVFDSIKISAKQTVRLYFAPIFMIARYFNGSARREKL